MTIDAIARDLDRPGAIARDNVDKALLVAGEARKGFGKGRLEQALERRAEREARRIQIEVQDDVVTLRGTVHSWAERKAAVAAVRFTAGVRGVDDQLRVEA